MAGDLVQGVQHGSRIDWFRPAFLPPAEAEQAMRNRLAACGGIQDHAGVPAGRIGIARVARDQAGAALDSGQEVVEIMRHPGCQLAERVHAFGMQGRHRGQGGFGRLLSGFGLKIGDAPQFASVALPIFGSGFRAGSVAVLGGGEVIAERLPIAALMRSRLVTPQVVPVVEGRARRRCGSLPGRAQRPPLQHQDESGQKGCACQGQAGDGTDRPGTARAAGRRRPYRLKAVPGIGDRHHNPDNQDRNQPIRLQGFRACAQQIAQPRRKSACRWQV